MKKPLENLPRFQLYQVDIPMPDGQHLIIAPTACRSLELSIEKDLIIAPGAMLFVWNVTELWLGKSAFAARHTWALLEERIEGHVEFDPDRGWLRDTERD